MPSFTPTTAKAWPLGYADPHWGKEMSLPTVALVDTVADEIEVHPIVVSETMVNTSAIRRATNFQECMLPPLPSERKDKGIA
jgi:hypothetical protein